MLLAATLAANAVNAPAGSLMVFALAGVNSRELGIAAGMPSSTYGCAGSSGGVLPT